MVCLGVCWGLPGVCLWSPGAVVVVAIRGMHLFKESDYVTFLRTWRASAVSPPPPLPLSCVPGVCLGTPVPWAPPPPSPSQPLCAWGLPWPLRVSRPSPAGAGLRVRPQGFPPLSAVAPGSGGVHPLLAPAGAPRVHPGVHGPLGGRGGGGAVRHLSGLWRRPPGHSSFQPSPNEGPLPQHSLPGPSSLSPTPLSPPPSALPPRAVPAPALPPSALPH